MNCGQVVAGELVVSGGYAPETFEPTKVSFDDVSAPVSVFVEAMLGDAVPLVGNDGSGAALDDVGSERVAVTAFVGDERARAGLAPAREARLRCRRRGRVSGETHGIGIRIAQRVNFRGAPAAQATDGLCLPPCPPLAERCASIDVESSDNAMEASRLWPKAAKIAAQRPRLAQRLKRL